MAEVTISQWSRPMKKTSNNPNKKAKSPKIHPPPKRRIGKPPKGDDARTTGVMVKVSKNELEYWRMLANAAGKPLSRFIVEPVRFMYPPKSTAANNNAKKQKKGE